MITARVLLVLASLATATSIARADGNESANRPETRRIIGLLHVEGPSSDVTRTFERNLEKKLDAKTHWLVPRAKMRERMRMSTKWSEGCLVGACLAEVKVQTSAEVVLLVALTGSGTSFGYVVTVVRTDTGRVLAQATDRCEVCTLNEAMASATTATVELINALPAQLPDDEARRRAERAAEIDSAIKQVEARRTADDRHTQRVGVTLTVAGLAATAVGAAAYYLQDDRPDYALATSTLGVGLVVGGVAVLTF